MCSEMPNNLSNIRPKTHGLSRPHPAESAAEDGEARPDEHACRAEDHEQHQARVQRRQLRVVRAWIVSELSPRVEPRQHGKRIAAAACSRVHASFTHHPRSGIPAFQYR